RLLAVENSAGIMSNRTKCLRNARPVAHQATASRKLPQPVHRRQRMARRQRNELIAPTHEERIGGNDQRLEAMLAKARDAASIACSVLAFTIRSCKPRDCAAACMSFVSSAAFGLVGLTRSPTALMPGTSSRNKPSRFAASTLLRKVTPVTLPPGRLRLGTSPALTGSLPIAKTIGIVVVAALAERADMVPRIVTI